MVKPEIQKVRLINDERNAKALGNFLDFRPFWRKMIGKFFSFIEALMAPSIAVEEALLNQRVNFGVNRRGLIPREDGRKHRKKLSVSKRFLLHNIVDYLRFIHDEIIGQGVKRSFNEKLWKIKNSHKFQSS